MRKWTIIITLLILCLTPAYAACSNGLYVYSTYYQVLSSEETEIKLHIGNRSLETHQAILITAEGDKELGNLLMTTNHIDKLNPNDQEVITIKLKPKAVRKRVRREFKIKLSSDVSERTTVIKVWVSPPKYYWVKIGLLIVIPLILLFIFLFIKLHQPNKTK